MGAVFLHFWLKQETEIKQSDFIEVENNSPTTSKGRNKAKLKPQHTGADWTLAQGCYIKHTQRSEFEVGILAQTRNL